MLQFTLDDRVVTVADDVAGTTTLLRYLRDHLHRTATKEGCAEGDCGACTVVVAETRDDGKRTYRAVNSCLLFLPMVHGKRVYTAQGLATAEQVHPVQDVMTERRASQCGYCTPGIVMSLFEACYRDDISESWEVDDQLCGNLCRCTGYRPIREAGAEVAGACPQDRFSAALAASVSEATLAEPHLVPTQTYFQPATLDELVRLRRDNPEAVLVAGGTDLGLAVTKRGAHWPVVIGLEAVVELGHLQRTQTHWRVGAAVNLTRLMETVATEIPALHKHLVVFGSRQIRSRATVGGNLCNASPIGDLPPVLMALGASAVVVGPSGERSLPLSSFFLDYRKTALAADEVLLRIDIPHPSNETLLGAYKVSKRRELDISICSAGMSVRLERGLVADVCLAYGGMAATPKRAAHTETALRGQPWTHQVVQTASEQLAVDFAPMDDHRGSAKYRALVAKNLLIGFFLETQQDERASVGTVGAQ
jgi:xanthine dehydrogenase small subunit